MKALVVGAYPPTPGSAAAATLARVRELLAEGTEVEVVSPVPSGAHRHADPIRLRGALQLSRLLMSAGQVEFFVDPGLLLSTGYAGRLPAPRRILGLALRRARQLTMHVLPVTVVLDPASVEAVLGAAERLVVGSSADREALMGTGLSRVEIEISGTTGPETVAGGTFQSTVDRALAGTRNGSDPEKRVPDPGPWQLPVRPTWEDLQAEICRRAAIRRGSAGAATAAAQQPPQTAAGWPLVAIPTMQPVPPESNRLGGRLFKKVLRRLVAWQIDPVVDHMNRLHKAAVETFRAQDRGQSLARSPGDPGPPSA